MQGNIDDDGEVQIATQYVGRRDTSQRFVGQESREELFRGVLPSHGFMDFCN